MRLFNYLTVLLLLCCSYSFAGTWTKVNATTIHFEGDIESGEFQKFSEAFSPSVTEIIVNSGGGSTLEGLKIGLAIAQQPIKIVVTGYCLSSCVNYIFVAGQSREIKDGIVGFHGNVKACFSGKNLEKTIAQVRASLFELNPSAPKEDVQSEIDRFLKSNNSEIMQESALLSKKGISQELFDRTCTLDKGAGDGKSYAFLLPTLSTFQKYGFQNVTGEQSKSVIAKFPGPLAID